MLFNSLGFALFFVIILLLYYSPLLRWSGKKWLLLLSSYVFYGLWNPPLIVLLWISTFIDWVAGNRLALAQRPTERKMWLLLSMAVNLGFLGFFKYGNFLLDNFVSLLGAVGIDFQAMPMDIVLPMGISFYTFQTMSYTIDIYRGRIAPARSFLDFALYVSFFPQLVAGPIVRAQGLIGQFYEEKRATARQFIWGSFLLTAGLFQKVVLADSLLSGTADAVFGSPQALHALDAWAGTLAFSGQIFFDFAGYSSCAIGIAMMLGFSLPDNFLYPYASIGFSDFWRRWHISLSSWLRDYLYIPLGGNRAGILRLYVALMVTMLLGGLWHGAAWTFVAWGFLHGTYLVGERLLRRAFPVKVSPLGGFALALLTFALVNIAWVFFRAKGFMAAKGMLAAMFFFFPEGAKVLGYFDLLKVGTLITALFLSHWFMRHQTLQSVAQRTPAWALGTLWAGMIFLLAIAQGSGEQFIYFQF